MSEFDVKELYIPYVNLVDRIAIILKSGSLSSDYLRFLISPGTYFTTLRSDVRVFQVDGGEHDGNEDPYREREAISPDKIREQPNDAEVDGDGNLVISPSTYITDRNPIQHDGIWEFKFFNKKNDLADSEFITEIRLILKQFTWQDIEHNGELIISLLKTAYNAKFTSGYQRNNISLITYAGPIYRTFKNTCSKLVPCHEEYRARYRNFCRPVYRHMDEYFESFFFSPSHRRCSHLYFGDVTLGVRLRANLEKHYTEKRWSKIYTIQVPHHGAKSSWKINEDVGFSHTNSIFSYGLHNTYKHPGKDVVSALSGRNPILVNELQGAYFIGYLAT